MNKIIVIALVVIAAFFAVKYFNDTKQSELETSEVTSTESTPKAAVPLSAELISPAAENAEVFIISPSNNETVTSPVTIKFGVKNMAIVKAGDTTQYSGHHHLLLNLDDLPDMSMPLPANENITHFGGAQTETTIELPAGQHSLQLLLGNFAHIPHSTPVLSKKIRITVSD